MQRWREGEAKDGERRRYVEYDGEQKVRGLMSARLAEGEGESRNVKKAEPQRIDAFELWCWRRLFFFFF